MLASISIPTLLLLASVAVAQEETPSVATSPFVSPTPSEEQIYTIQTSDPWACYEDCIQPPCPPCPSGSLLSIPPIPMPTPISESIATDITDPGFSTVSGIMSIPTGEIPASTGSMTSISAGETPISSGAVDTSVASSSDMTMTGSPAGSELPQATTNAAALHAKADGVPFVAAMAGALALL